MLKKVLFCLLVPILASVSIVYGLVGIVSFIAWDFSYFLDNGLLFLIRVFWFIFMCFCIGIILEDNE